MVADRHGIAILASLNVSKMEPVAARHAIVSVLERWMPHTG